MLVLHKMWFEDWTKNLEPNVISASGKVRFREPKSKQAFVKKMQRDNEGLFFPAPAVSHVERQHLFLWESGNKVNPSWLKNKYTLQFAAVTRRAEAPGARGPLQFQKARM